MIIYFNPHWTTEKTNKIQQCHLCKLDFAAFYFKCEICSIKVHSNCAFRHLRCNYPKLSPAEFENSLLNVNTRVGQWFFQLINLIVDKLDKKGNIFVLLKNSFNEYKKVLITINYDIKSEFYNIGKNLLLKTFYQVIMNELEQQNLYRLKQYKIEHKIIDLSDVDKMSAKKTPQEKCDCLYQMMTKNKVKDGDESLDLMIQCLIQTKDSVNWLTEFLFIKKFLVEDNYRKYILIVLESALE